MASRVLIDSNPSARGKALSASKGGRALHVSRNRNRKSFRDVETHHGLHYLDEPMRLATMPNQSYVCFFHRLHTSDAVGRMLLLNLIARNA